MTDTNKENTPEIQPKLEDTIIVTNSDKEEDFKKTMLSPDSQAEFEYVEYKPPILPNLKEGGQVANFILERKIGSGGMGEVWLAHQTSMSRNVALKILSPAFNNDEDFIKRFMHEVKLSAQLDHPNIITAHDAGFSDGVYFLAISFVDGVELTDKIEEAGTLEEKEVLEIALAIAHALKYAWDEFELIHRDIKPSNIMIDKNGSPKLMDMGISKSVKISSGNTMTGVIVGTPHYMSLEQATANAELDCTADIYSLGATLFHALAGDVPYDSETSMGVLAKHMTDPVPSVKEKNPKITSQCNSMIKKMMSKEKGERYQTWDEVIKDIELTMKGGALSFSAGGGVRRPADKKEEEKRRALFTSFNNVTVENPPQNNDYSNRSDTGKSTMIKLKCQCGLPMILLKSTPGEVVTCRVCGFKITIPENPDELKDLMRKDLPPGQKSIFEKAKPAPVQKEKGKPAAPKIKGRLRCPKCGVSNEKKAVVCRECGEDFSGSQSAFSTITRSLKKIIDKICYEDVDEDDE